MEKEIKGATILHAVVVFDGNVSNNDLEEGFGSITLKRENREFILDIVNSNWFFDGEKTEVDLTLEVDLEVFGDCKYDLTDLDLHSRDLEATIFIGEVDDILISATLFVKLGEMTQAIDLKLD